MTSGPASGRDGTRRLLGAALALVVLGLGPAARGQEPSRLDAGQCIQALAGPEGLAGGIAMPGPARAAFVRLCDGQVFQVALGGGGLALLPADRMSGPFAPRANIAGFGGLPDGQLTRGRGSVQAAMLTGPTRIYGHGILGDAIEASGFRVIRLGDAVLDLALGPDSVFEDLRVRVVDLTGDNEEEFVVIHSTLDRGAALAVYGLTGAGLALLAETPPIGQPNRWLNPAGAADFDGDGKVEIALVETPHIGGVLELYELGPGGLAREQRVPGFSNHAIGSRVLDMAAVLDWNGDGVQDLALPDAARRRLKVVSFAGGDHSLLATLPSGAPITTEVLATDLDGDGTPELLYARADGALALARP